MWGGRGTSLSLNTKANVDVTCKCPCRHTQRDVWPNMHIPGKAVRSARSSPQHGNCFPTLTSHPMFPSWETCLSPASRSPLWQSEIARVMGCKDPCFRNPRTVLLPLPITPITRTPSSRTRPLPPCPHSAPSHLPLITHQVCVLSSVSHGPVAPFSRTGAVFYSEWTVMASLDHALTSRPPEGSSSALVLLTVCFFQASVFDVMLPGVRTQSERSWDMCCPSRM